MKSPLLLMVSMIGTIRRDHPCYARSESLKDLKTIRARFKREGMGFLSKTLPSLESAILQALESGTFTCPSSFRKRKELALPRFLGGLLDKMFDAKTGDLLDFDPCLLKNLRQLLVMFKKTQLSPKNLQILTNRAYAKFRSIEQRLSSGIPASARQLDIFDRVSSIGLSRFEFTLEDFKGKHGPGAVVESLRPNEKWLHTYQSSLLSNDNIVSYLNEIIRVSSHGNDVLVDSRGRSSRLSAVPKNSTSVRLITIEPCMKQFIQGGINLSLRSFIEKDPIYQRCLDLTDQSKSRDYALKGSLDGSYATIDLSSASDTIDSELVHRIFARHQDFLKILISSSRTPHIEISGETTIMEKYAGMGNATTFPIMSIMFANIIFAAMCDYDGKQPTYQGLRHYASMFQVYGDDIAVPTEYSSKVAQWLVDFGFIPNLDKSFSKGNFRESCGLDSYKGVDVTPIYVRVWPEELRKTDASSLVSLVSTSNQFWLDANYGVSNVIKACVEEVFGKLPQTRPDNGSIGWVSRKLRVPLERWNSELHRMEHRAFCVRARKRSDPLDGIPALLKFFHVAYDRNKGENLEDVRPKGHLEKSSQRRTNYVVRAWFPS